MSENPAPSGRSRKALVAVLAVALVAALVWVVVLLMQQASGPGAGAPGTSSPAASPTDTQAPGTTSPPPTTMPAPTSAPTTPGLPAEEAAQVVWPDPAGTLRYDTPEDAAAGFAEDFAGFTDPLYGEFQQGDSRSGELEVTAVADGAVTTVLLRELSDGNWYAIGATSSEIQVEVPEPGAQINAPVAVSGQSRAFEAVVEVAVRAHGSSEPLGTGIVMGGAGPELGPFSGSIDWDNPESGAGALLFFQSSAKDGTVWVAAAVPVGFAPQP
ncbi:Gmad2 immunoglobulin-like domain-containing protein [Zafaria sp. J156]|uniref:Gmad2 immunoglobulin-like domain-containing protein n=1 Tax=Zafaria sp. J156 TaxID=3116490 RepID=UPI002E791AA1|nr:Gmad2 immunoglobulin-like domain-containing protein [Zafaria sp. J156]MEE1620999.1 Gmad2 immunoglobulin-like domain-containing protein [Zafaria sp. J156]